MSLVQRMHFLQDVFQMTAITLVSVINHYHINWLHLFWDTQYIYIYIYMCIYIYIYICVCVCVRVCVCVCIRSMDFQNTKSWHGINKYGAYVSPCKTPVTMLKMIGSLSSERTMAFVFLKSIITAVMGGDHMQVGFDPSFFCVWNQMPSKNLRTTVLPRDSSLVLLRWLDELSEYGRLRSDSFEKPF